MTTTVQQVIDRARFILQDASAVRWTSPELIIWTSDAQREIVTLKPEAYTTRSAVLLTAGPVQTIPATSYRLIDVVRNMGLDGLTPGAAIRGADKRSLDAAFPNWYAMTPTAAVKHFMYSEYEPRKFEVYPPNTGTGYVELKTSLIPSALTATTDNLLLDDAYVHIILNYVLYRAYAKDAEFAANAALATAYRAAFDGALASRGQNEVARDVTAQGG